MSLDLTERTLGEFRLSALIGEGGHGQVYRAHQAGLEREAVVKVLGIDSRGKASATDRFLREARLASRLDHPYAAHIYAFGAETDGLLWIAMELVRGTPLDRLLEHAPLPLERGGGLRLLHEAPPAIGIRDQLLGQHLERHLAIEADVDRAVDDPHAAAADLLDDLVVGKGPADHEAVRRL